MDAGTGVICENLETLGRVFGTDKYDHGYLPHYEKLFRHPGRLLEIGVHFGGSLRMWQVYFGPSGKVVGVDINLAEGFSIEGVDLIESDATTQKFFDYVAQFYGSFDYVVDDGSHKTEDILASLSGLWPLVRPGGWYVIEDLGTAFWPDWGGSDDGSRVTETIYFNVLNLLRGAGGLSEIHIFEEIVFFRKKSI